MGVSSLSFACDGLLNSLHRRQVGPGTVLASKMCLDAAVEGPIAGRLLANLPLGLMA